MTQQPWTNHAEQILARLWASPGWSAEDIATYLQRGPGSIRARAKRLKLRRPPGAKRQPRVTCKYGHRFGDFVRAEPGKLRRWRKCPVCRRERMAAKRAAVRATPRQMHESQPPQSLSNPG